MAPLIPRTSHATGHTFNVGNHLKMKIDYVFLTLFLNFGINSVFGQCEGLKSWSDPQLVGHLEFGSGRWQQAYSNYFRSDSCVKLIAADSVLMSYLSHPENQTNYGMPCCYILATEFAEIELEAFIKSLYQNIGKIDSLNFKESQNAWNHFYQNEREFIYHAFVGYSNYSKYGRGREIMIDDAANIYELIKERIVNVKYYVEISDYYEETNDD